MGGPPAGVGPGPLPLIVPFRIDVDPMERLLLVNFERDPDDTYVGMEPQVFDDAIHGSGHLVIGWRQDGRVDVYHQPGLKLSPGRYDITGKGLAHMVERQFAAATYEVDDSGVQAHYEFTDIHGRAVVIRISERNPRRRKPFGLLAPMGAVAEAPSALPLVLLHEFYFVRKKRTAIEISFDGAQHRPDELPVPMDFTRMLFTRYSPRPLIATLNPAYDGLLEPLQVRPGQAQTRSGEHSIALEWTTGVPAISRVTRRHPRYPVELRFDRPFPDIGTLADNTHVTGGFDIAGHPSTGRIVGAYTVEKTNGQAKVVMIPTPGWKPCPTKLSLRFLYTVARVFSHWPTTYRWTAIIQERDHGARWMRSEWCRIS
ncbi:MAG: hypothetical protein EA382_17490 [Spirochaetaceae bacterium]|nr:MAG: hypothetical protein EA382_17490 [Spirochaetaceae bacterium]